VTGNEGPLKILFPPSRRVFREPQPAPHQGRREAARRLRQVRAGRLQGAVVSEEARYAAHGLVAPGSVALIERV
jgi:hypothetical protein